MAQKKQPKGSQGEFYSSSKARSAYIDGVNFFSKSVVYAEVEGMAIFEGDIILGTVEEVEARTQIRKQEIRGELAMGVVKTGEQYRWPNCTIPYTIDSSLTNQARVTDAIAHWETNTNIKFVLRTSSNASQYPDYVTFRPGSGCSSYVGKVGGQQFINLGSGCSTGNTIHEIGHTVGLWHEHSREDRDSFVTIHWDKIQAGTEHNFSQRITDGDDVGAYDYGSIMHYPRNAFSIDGTDTITPVNPAAQIGQRVALSASDIATVNSIYNCPQILCPVAPITICPAAPIQVKCPPAPYIPCPAPIQPICPPAPIHQTCPPAPWQPICPPAPWQPVCPPAPWQPVCPAPFVVCRPAPKILGCTVAPYKRPFPGPDIYERIPRLPIGYGDPYGYGAMYGYGYGNPYASDWGMYGDPYGYGNWTNYEYPDPYTYGYKYPGDPFNPGFSR